MAVQIQYRRGLASEWAGVNPTLALGEPGFETDTGRIKVGTGGTAWNDLTYTVADSFLNGSGAPGASLGKVGDFYLDTSVYALYGPKTDVVGNEWGTGVFLTGNTLLSGTTAPDASVGRDGDFYIDTAANQIYGPKTDTVGDEWGTPTNLQVVSIDDLSDVDTSTATPQAGEALVWDDANSVWKPGPAGAEASGAIGQIQYNDGASPTPGLAASADLTWDNTAKELGIGGDINLDSGGGFATTIQSVTPTANRTISFPDQTGTVGLVSGATGNIQFNNAGQLAGTGDLNTELDWVSPTGTYTALKVNADSNGGNTGTLLDLQVDGASRLAISALGSPLVGLTSAYDSGTAKGYYFASNNISLRSTGTGIGVYSRLNNYPSFYFGTPIAGLGHRISSDIEFGWSSSTIASNPPDLTFARDAADTLAQRRGTNAQTYRLYNTYTDASNYQRTSINDDSTGLIIDQQYAGTGAARTNLLDLKDNGTSKFTVIANAGSGSVQLFMGNTPVYSVIQSTNIRSKLTPVNLSFTNAAGNAVTSLDYDATNNLIAITDGATGAGYLKQTPVLVGDLPAAATVGAGTRGFVSDATATTFASVVTGSGTASTAGTVPVYSDGTDWRIG